MQEDFHYYATYCAAYIAGFTHEESLAIGYSSQYVDLCSASRLDSLKGPNLATTTQFTMEMANNDVDRFGKQKITQIWSSFHFLPFDLYAKKPGCGKTYLNKYRLICGPNGQLVEDVVMHAKGKNLQACGIAMHVLADTWAHSYHAGTPSLVINNSTGFTEIIEQNGSELDRPITFVHKLGGVDDVDNGIYTASIYQANEDSIMNLGHGRCGHLPDYSYIKYRFMPAWNDYNEITKDNPSDYYHAFCQMVHALLYLHGERNEFSRNYYEDELMNDLKDEIMTILRKRQVIACEDWKKLGEILSGKTIEDFDVTKYEKEYTSSDRDSKSDTFLGRFFDAAISHKSLVTNKIIESGNKLAGNIKIVKESK